MLRVDGKTLRVKTCIRCGAVLPTQLTFPKKYEVLWFVREFHPETGQSKDVACKTSEAADELIRLRQRDYTPDPIRVELLEYTSVLIRQIQADNRVNAINELIVKLGGDPTARTLKPIGWDEARELIVDELRQKGRSES